MEQLSVPSDWQDKLVAYLEQENYLNEERFANAFVRGKLRHNHWSRNHIKSGLRAKRISEQLIRRALLEEVDPDQYFQTILKLVVKKWPAVKAKSVRERREKLIASLARAGFELDLIIDAVNSADLA